MKVVIIANGFQEDYIINLLNSLAGKVDKLEFIGSSIYSPDKINADISFLNLRGEHNEDVSLFKKIRRIIKYYFRLIKFIFKTDAKIIHIQWLRFYITEGILFSLLCRLLRKKVFYTAHDVLPHMKDNKQNRIIFKCIYKIQNYLVVHTDFIKKRLINEFKIAPEKIFLVKHGVYNVIENSEITKFSARKHLGINNNDFVILFFGIITRYKGMDLLLSSFKKLESELSNVKLVIAGKVENEYKKEYESIIKENRTDNILRFMKYIYDDEVEYFFKSADVTVLPYLEASQSGVLFLSYAFGIPVIVPELGSFPDDILVGKTGYLFEPGNTESLYNTIKLFLSEWQLANDNSYKYIKDFAQTNYSWESTGKELAKLYRNY